MFLKMRVYLGSDHAAFELKQALIDHLRVRGDQPIDCGPAAYDPDDDYPVYVLRAATRTAFDPQSRGIVLGGSGNGEAITANKVPGIRAAVAWNEETARLARAHNDAQVLSLGARQLEHAQALLLVDIFLETPFSGEERHRRRVGLISTYERTGST